jgi:hypothetical protein
MTTNPKKKANPIDVLVDTMVKYYFRLHGFDDMAQGTVDIHGSDFPDNLEGMFTTVELRDAEKQLESTLQKLTKLLPKDKAVEIIDELDRAHRDHLYASIEYPRLQGFVFGMLLAGLPAEHVKNMAKTWKLGLPNQAGSEVGCGN